MARSYWLVKQEPTKYSFDQLVKDKRTTWDGVRNYQARNNLKEMKVGDKVLFYHSVIGTAVVGICEVVQEARQDPSTTDERWLAVDLAAVKTLKTPVTLEEIKKIPALKDIKLLRQSRLSVMPLSKEEFDTIVRLGG